MDIESLLSVLGVPMRYRIFTAVLERKHCVRSLSKKLQVSESAISQHLKIMREAGLVYGEKYGYHTHYLPKQETVDFLAESFEQIRTKSIEVDRNISVCQCEYREGTSK